MRKSLRIESSCIVAACLLSLATAHAVADEARQITVPAGSLNEALRSLARQSDVDLVYQADKVEGMQTGGLTGIFTTRDAVEKLIAGTSLHLSTDADTGAMFITSGDVGGRTSERPLKVAFDIPAQPLEDALESFARQSNLRVVFDKKLTQGITSPAIVATLTPEEALQELIEPAGLQAGYLDATTIQISAATGVAAPAGAARSYQPAAAAGERAGVALSKDSAGAVAAFTTDCATVNGVPNPACELETVIVTGVVNQGVIPRIEHEAVRYEVIDRVTIERSGVSTLGDLLARNVSQSSNYGTGTQQTFGSLSSSVNGVSTPQDRINLRGFGSNETLVLINGRRLYGSDSEGPDISRIPLSMVDHVEILPTAGSAIYGANAMGGVVNIVLRKDYQGSEYSAYVGTAKGGAEEYRLSGFHGFNLGDGKTSVSANVEVKKIEPLLMRERKYYSGALARVPSSSPDYRNQVIRPFVGPRGTVSAGFLSPGGLGIPSNPDAAFAGIPAGSTGVGLAPDSFNADAGSANIDTSRLDRSPLLGGSESVGLFSTLEHDFTDRWSMFSELSFNWADNGIGEYGELLPNFILTPFNPNNPFPGSFVNVNVDPVDVPRARQSSIQKSYRAVVGVRGLASLFESRQPYNWSADVSWDRNETHARTVTYTEMLLAATQAGLYNPLRDLTGASLLPPDQLDNLRTTVDIHSKPEIFATNWRMNGQLFEIWGGMSEVSLGAEYRSQFQDSRIDFTRGAYSQLPNLFFLPQSSAVENERNSYAAYVEVKLPLVGERNRMLLVQTLELVGSVRYEKYSDFEAAHPPLVAFKWSLLPDVALRAQYSEGFQPPTLDDLSAPVVQSPPLPNFDREYNDPQRPGLPNTDALVVVTGGNPQLRPSIADTWDLGVIFTPRWARGLTLTAAYFQYDKKDIAGVPTLQDSVNAGKYVRGPNLPGDPSGVPGPIVQIDQTIANKARQYSTGWDLRSDYEWAAGVVGDFKFSVQATYTEKFEQQAVAGDPRVDSLGDLTYGNEVPLEWRGQAKLDWQRRGWGVSWVTHYFSSFETFSNQPTPQYPFRTGIDGGEIPSRVDHDLQIRYRAVQAVGAPGGFMSGADLTFGVKNVFDRKPEYLTDSSKLWYSYFADPRQRFVYLQLKKSF